MRGSRPLKPPALLRGHRAVPALTPLDGVPGRVTPRPPQNLLPESRALWRTVWRSRVAGAWDAESDLGALTRYIQHFDRYLRFEAVVRQAPLVRGSREQLRPNPLLRPLEALEGQLRALEEQLGLTPLARVRLGVELVDGATRRQRWELAVAALEDEEDPRQVLRRSIAPGA